MKLLQMMIASHAQQKQDFESNKREVSYNNIVTLKSASLILASACLGIFIISLFLPNYFSMRLTYGVTLLIVGIFLLFIFKIVRTRIGSLLCSYLLFSFFFAFTIYLSVIVSPMHRTTIFLGLLLIVPFLIVDKAWRLNLFLLVAFLLHSALALHFKGQAVVYEDIINSVIFLLMGIFIGGNIRKTKLENYRLQRQATALSEIDFLTGLYNRRKMYQIINDNKHQGKHIKGVIICDIDYFKGFNDHYGHQAGDDCLTQIGAFLKEFGAKNNLHVFRFGGEEFIGLVYDGDCDSLLTIAESLREGIYQLNIPYPHQKSGRVSISVGFCTNSSTESAPIEQLISGADKGLYQAKSNGRNCCVKG